jgi:hypothetical protein
MAVNVYSLTLLLVWCTGPLPLTLDQSHKGIRVSLESFVIDSDVLTEAA